MIVFEQVDAVLMNFVVFTEDGKPIPGLAVKTV